MLNRFSMLQVRIFDAQTKVREEVPDSLNFPTLRIMCLCARVIGSFPLLRGRDERSSLLYIRPLLGRIDCRTLGAIIPHQAKPTVFHAKAIPLRPLRGIQISRSR
jgi:hypothetical protein